MLSSRFLRLIMQMFFIGAEIEVPALVKNFRTSFVGTVVQLLLSFAFIAIDLAFIEEHVGIITACHFDFWGALLSQIGEFSLVLCIVAKSLDLVDDFFFQLTPVVISIAMLFSSVWISIIRKALFLPPTVNHMKP